MATEKNDIGPKEVDVIGLMGALRKNGKAKLSDHYVNENENENQNKTTEDKTMTANDFIGKIIKAGNAQYIIKSVEGNILQTEFRMGSTTMACPVNVELANKNIEAGKWTLADAGAAANENETPTATKTGSQKAQKAQKKTEVEPKAEPTTTKTKPEPETRNLKPETKAEPETCNVKPETKLKCIDYTNKKGKKCAKIVGFSETDEAYTNAIELHASGSYERNKKGEKVYYIAFGPRYAEVAHAVCATLNTHGATLEAAKAIIDKQTADNAQKREEWKAKREEHKANANGNGNANKGKPKGKTEKLYTEAEVRKAFKSLADAAEMDVKEFEPIIEAMQKAA